MMNNMTLPFTVVFSVPIPFIIMSTVFSHKCPLKYKNVVFNPSNINTIHFVPYLVGYLLISFKKYF